MPKLHFYKKDQHGMYIVANHDNSFVTYQVTPDGRAELRRNGYREGDDIDRDLFFELLNRQLIYTGGSGPGVVEDIKYKDKYIENSRLSNNSNRLSTTHRGKIVAPPVQKREESLEGLPHEILSTGEDNSIPVWLWVWICVGIIVPIALLLAVLRGIVE